MSCVCLCRVVLRFVAARETVRGSFCERCWAEAPIKIARMTLTIKLDGNWSSFQLANSAPPLCVTDSAIAPSARMLRFKFLMRRWFSVRSRVVFSILAFFGFPCDVAALEHTSICFSDVKLLLRMAVVRRAFPMALGPESPAKIVEVTLMRPIHGNL